MVEERKDGAGGAHTEYVWDARYIDAPVVRWQDANGDGDTSDSGETLYYTNDANFNVTAVVDTSGNVVERYMYDPYGNVTVLDADWSSDADGASDVSNEILYCGYRYDTETGLYHVRHRMYHPTLGRWMTRDPIGYADGMNLQEYAGGATAQHIDPYGLDYARREKCLGYARDYARNRDEAKRGLQKIDEQAAAHMKLNEALSREARTLRSDRAKWESTAEYAHRQALKGWEPAFVHYRRGQWITDRLDSWAHSDSADPFRAGTEGAFEATAIEHIIGGTIGTLAGWAGTGLMVADNLGSMGANYMETAFFADALV